MTGSATCEEVVKQTLGEDLTNPEVLGHCTEGD